MLLLLLLTVLTQRAFVGWLMLLQNGFLHRDVSIGNLLQFRKPKACKPFSTESILKLKNGPLADQLARMALDDSRPVGDNEFWERLEIMANEDEDLKQVIEYAYKVQCALATLPFDVSTGWEAIICDGDMAAYIPDYSDNNKHGGDILASLNTLLMRKDANLGCVIGYS